MRSLALAAILLAPILAEGQSIDAGQKAFQACAACHDVGPAARSKVGPPLNGMFGRTAGSQEGFPYSPAMRASNITWTDESFAAYLTNPKALVPGTKMAFAGIADAQRIADIAAYLKAFDASGQVAVGSKASPPVAPAADSLEATINPGTLECIRSFAGPDHAKACAEDGGDLLQAIGALVGGLPMEGYGWFDGRGLIDRDDTDAERFVRRLRASATDPCRLEELQIMQSDKRPAANLLLTDYDFRAIKRVRYLVKNTDFLSGADNKPDDPGVQEIAVEGPDVVCTETLAIDPAKGKFRECESALVLNAYGPENRAVAMPALAIVRNACGWPNDAAQSGGKP